MGSLGVRLTWFDCKNLLVIVIIISHGTSLRKHPFLLALRSWATRNVLSGKEQGETDVFAG